MSWPVSLPWSGSVGSFDESINPLLCAAANAGGMPEKGSRASGRINLPLEVSLNGTYDEPAVDLSWLFGSSYGALAEWADDEDKDCDVMAEDVATASPPRHCVSPLSSFTRSAINHAR